ncbi:MAG: hypothetical protein IJ507_10665 [Clostridia bacterium]|nr:hypothetical protein [Clostridia bacterium]
MRRIICVLLIMLFLPCASLAQDLSQVSEYTLQTGEIVDYIHDVHLLPDGKVLLRYYTADHGDFARSAGKEGQLYNHYMSIFTAEGGKVWQSMPDSYELARRENDQQIILRPDCFIWEYYPNGSRYDYCRTAYGFDGSVRDVVLDIQTRDTANVWSALAHYSLGIAYGDREITLEAVSLTTGASAQIPVDAEGVFHAAEIAGQLAVLVRSEDDPAVIRFYDENLQEVRVLETPITHGEAMEMAERDGMLYCFAMYAGDWESYYVYACDLSTGRWQAETPYVRLPGEYCSLNGVIPCGDGFLLLINEGDSPEHPAPFGPHNWNYTDRNLYMMTPDGSLSLCLDLNGDARLLPRTDENTFTLLMRSESSGQYVLRTYALTK